MRERVCWGIFRERAHSPYREFDDAEILRFTGKYLEAHGFQVSLRTPEEVAETGEECPPCALAMCERPAILERLRQWERRGVRVVNAPSAILNTYRDRMIALFARHAIAFPDSTLIPTARSPVRWSGPGWVKRADVHCTQEGDVVFARNTDEVSQALCALARRAIPRAVLQRDLQGDLVKFYGVGSPSRVPGYRPWFRWFYHRDQDVAGYRFAPEALAQLAQRAAAVLGLEVYGGDAVVTDTGRLVLIDLNAWPSFALYREEAAERIASYLARRFTQDGA